MEPIGNLLPKNIPDNPHEEIRAVIEKLFGDDVSIYKIDEETLILQTKSSVLAGEVQYKKPTILKNIRSTRITSIRTIIR